MLYEECKVLQTNMTMLNDIEDFVARSTAYPVTSWQWTSMAVPFHIIWMGCSPSCNRRGNILVHRIMEKCLRRQKTHLCGHHQAVHSTDRGYDQLYADSSHSTVPFYPTTAAGMLPLRFQEPLLNYGLIFAIRGCVKYRIRYGSWRLK